jgi:hypothetical protein
LKSLTLQPIEITIGQQFGLVYVAHPAQANTIRFEYGGLGLGAPVWSSLGVAPGTLIALDPAAFASAFGSDPEIGSDKHSLLYSDTAPLQIGTAGSPPTVAAPAVSLFQTDKIATRLLLKCAWTWRVAGAWLDSATW